MNLDVLTTRLHTKTYLIKIFDTEHILIFRRKGKILPKCRLYGVKQVEQARDQLINRAKLITIIIPIFGHCFTILF